MCLGVAYWSRAACFPLSSRSAPHWRHKYCRGDTLTWSVQCSSVVFPLGFVTVAALLWVLFHINSLQPHFEPCALELAHAASSSQAKCVRTSLIGLNLPCKLLSVLLPSEDSWAPNCGKPKVLKCEAPRSYFVLRKLNFSVCFQFIFLHINSLKRHKRRHHRLKQRLRDEMSHLLSLNLILIFTGLYKNTPVNPPPPPHTHTWCMCNSIFLHQATCSEHRILQPLSNWLLSKLGCVCGKHNYQSDN